MQKEKMKKSALAVLTCAALSACSHQDDLIENANVAMKAQVASDISLSIDADSERYFKVQRLAENGSGDRFDYVCGRTTVDQPGYIDHKMERFIIFIRNGKPTITFFDGSDEESGKKEFADRWDVSCPGYILPRS
jgi:hypothetical protein